MLHIKPWISVWNAGAQNSQPCTSNTSIKIIKNEVGCRDDTVLKTVDTRRHCEEE